MTSTDAIDKAQIEKTLKGLSIPPQPQILTDINDALSDGDGDLKRVGDLIGKDVALAAAVLKMINSPFYGLRQKLNSVQRAVFLLGATNMANLARGAILRSTMGDGSVMLERFWQSASDVAAIAAYIAKFFHLSNQDEYYTLGLFHDCGIAVLAQKFPDYKETLKAANQSFDKVITEFEDEAYDTNHTIVGYYMCKSWNLSGEISQVVLEHHNLDKLYIDDENQGHRNLMMAILKMANNISHTRRRLAVDHEWDIIGEATIQQAGITQDEYEDLKHDVHDMLDD